MVDLTNLLIDIEDQRHYNSCVGQSLSTYLEAIWKKFDPDNAQEFSPAFIWYVTKGDTDNTGVIPAFALAQLKKIGCCLEKTFPYTDLNLNRQPPPECYVEAKKYRIGSYKAVTYEELKTYLDKGLPISISMNFDGGHRVTLFGYRDGIIREWLVVNSWGNQWMDQGKQWMSDDEFKKRFKGGHVITGLKWQFLKNAKKWFKEMFK